MKNLERSILLLAIVLVSCSMSKQERLIKQFEETLGTNTKTDLSFKTKEIHLVSSITAKDSLDYFVKIFKERFYDSPNSADEILKMTKIELTGGNEALDSLRIKIAEVKSKGENYQILQNIIDKYEPMIILGRKVQNGIEKYISSPNAIVGNKWQCTYTIENPLLNNAKQEITNTYLFNGNNSKLISRLSE